MQAWLIFSILVILLWGLWGFVTKLAVNHVSPKSAFALSFVGYSSVIIYMLLTDRPLRNLNLPGALWSLLAGALTAWAVYFYFRAIEVGKVAIIVPFTALYVVVALALSVGLLGESLSGTQIAGVVCAVAAGVLVSL